jgi:AraC-like DNA-binding protein
MLTFDRRRGILSLLQRRMIFFMRLFRVLEDSMYNDIYPVQPFLMTNTTKYYKMKLPGSPIVHFYAFEAETMQKNIITTVPDGCVDLLFEISDSGANGFAYGTVTKSRTLDVSGGGTFFGVRFKPGYLPDNLDVSLPELVDTHISLRDTRGGSALVDGMAAADGFAAQIDTMLRFIGGEWRQCDLLQMLIANIERGSGTKRVAELEEETHYSARYLDKVFRQQLGLSPKVFSNIIRFQTMLKKINEQRGGIGANLAAEFGYYDQSHMIKEFKEFAAVTPKEYFAAVDLPNYGKQIVTIGSAEL